MAFDVWMAVLDWERGSTGIPTFPRRPQAVANNVDHICQMLGSSENVGIGTDLDGGFGNEQTPVDLKTIADLKRFREILKDRGYSDDDPPASHRNYLDSSNARGPDWAPTAAGL